MQNTSVSPDVTSGATYSNFTFEQWQKNKIRTAHWTLNDAKENIRQAKETMDYAIKQAREKFLKKKNENIVRIQQAKAILAEEKTEA